MSPVVRAYYQTEYDITVRFRADNSFLIMNDQPRFKKIVSDKVVMALFNGETVPGWEPCEF